MYIKIYIYCNQLERQNAKLKTKIIKMKNLVKTSSQTKGEKIANQIFNIIGFVPIILFAYYIGAQLTKLF